ncbi:MAG: M67 family metallopeptidase [Deltaproteobacteria bacterium]|jgi:proteasome lid subunit RPN8/RPN11|nr:M67 family metallopeptidase [Deltaproteobacteria bacterium]
MIALSPSIDALIRSEGERAYPYECCGLVLGESAGPDGETRRITRAVSLDNTREGEARRRRFVIEPADFLRAEREALAAGLEVLGIYHSHPDHPAVPSDYDLSHALPFYSYIIVSVGEGRADELTSWRLADDRGRFAPEPVELTVPEGGQDPPVAGPPGEH